MLPSPSPPPPPPHEEAQRNSITNKTRSLPRRCNPPGVYDEINIARCRRRLGNRDDRRLFAESLPVAAFAPLYFPRGINATCKIDRIKKFFFASFEMIHGSSLS